MEGDEDGGPPGEPILPGHTRTGVTGCPGATVRGHGRLNTHQRPRRGRSVGLLLGAGRRPRLAPPVVPGVEPLTPSPKGGPFVLRHRVVQSTV